MHKPPHKNTQPVHKNQGMLSTENITIFSCFTPQWEQNANLQPASLWSIKWYLRWSIYGHIAICLNPIKSTEEATVYCWRLVNKWMCSSGLSLWWTWQFAEDNDQVWALLKVQILFCLFLPLYVSGNDKRQKNKVSSSDVHGLLMIHWAFAAETLHSALPIDMVMPCMFMHTYIFSFQRATTNAWDERNIWKIGHCC